jgi:hypothetical protein
MESAKNLKAILKSLLMLCILLACYSPINAQQTGEDLKDFEISMERTGNKIIMSCSEGCAWKNLSFSNYKESQLINQYGMTKLTEKASDNDPESAEFLIQISKTADGLELKGLRGTAWIDLDFSLKENQKQMVNQFGMTK